MTDNLIRLNKYLSQVGAASRRKADELIAQGRITVNGKIIKELGTKVNPLDVNVELDGVPVDKPSKKKHYYALYKPQNVMTTMQDPAKRPCIGDLVNTMDVHAFPVGRLDFDTEGLLLLTNDGEASHAMLHPKFHVEKTYRVKVKGQPDKETIDKLRQGVKLDDGFAKPTFVAVEKTLKENTWVTMKITQGRNHIVKRMWLRMGHPVLKLIRTGFGPIDLGGLKTAQIRKLTPSEIKSIQKITAKLKP